MDEADTVVLANYEEEEGRPGKLEGLLVEIVDVSGPAHDAESGLEVKEPNGLRGRATTYQQGRYFVETFGGFTLDVPEANVQEFEPPKPEDGGFDLVWPAESPQAEAAFSLMVGECLKMKGYCYIQAFESVLARDAFMKYTDQMSFEYTQVRKEFQDVYVGTGPRCKVMMLEAEEVAKEEGVMHYNSYLKNAHLAIGPVAAEMLGFEPWPARMSTMIRQPLGDGEEDKLDPGPLGEGDVQERVVEKFIEFAQRRKLCMMYMVNGAGGFVELQPREDLSSDKVTLSIASDRLLIFRHDLMNYSYEPEDKKDLVLQSWIVEPPAQLQVMHYSGAAEELMENRGPSPPAGPGKQTWITSFWTRSAGNAYGQEQAWAVFMSNVDGYIEIPKMRFDLDIYYSADGDFGKTRTKHSALVTDMDLVLFDNVFFNWSEEQAYASSCCARLSIDAAYQLLYSAGIGREECRGEAIGFYLGHCADPESNTGYSSVVQLPYFLGLTGRTSIVDTACSSALVAICGGHQDVALNRTEAVLCAGVGVLLQVGPYIAMSSGRMISSRGRSHTFDHSADGYGRGEGIAGVLLERASSESNLRQRMKCKEALELARFGSSAMNQDGRSASITAPSGPAQQACIKTSLREGGFVPAEIMFHECHGTGTALGDPIEVGSSRMVNDSGRREQPLLFGAAKTQVGHLELGAGAMGALRAICLLGYSAVPGNAHVKQLNEHFSLDGFPCGMPVELIDYGSRNAMVGVNSFGFGGTNSRAELWGYARVGPRSIENRAPDFDKLHYVTLSCPKCMGPMCYNCGVAIPKSAAFRGKHYCSAIREVFDSYDTCSNCYIGKYTYGVPDYEDWANPGKRIYALGSWTGWNKFEELEQAEDGSYEIAICLGETRMEQFRLALEMDDECQSIHPPMDRASAGMRIFGPDDEGQGKSWLINGKADGMMEGTIYKISFQWESSWKTISWEPSEELLPKQQFGDFKHSYAIAGSWNNWQPVPLLRSMTEHSSWEGLVTIGRQGREGFHFVRDQDKTQIIYPAQDKDSEGASLVEGPDGNHNGRHFVVIGIIGEKVEVVLRFREGEVIVTANSPTSDLRTWTSGPRKYYVFGTWTDWELVEMEEDGAEQGIYRCRLMIGSDGREQFQVVMDQDMKRRMYPSFPNAPPGQSAVKGPDDEGKEMAWDIAGDPGDVMEVILDLDAEDRRDVVTCRLSTQ